MKAGTRVTGREITSLSLSNVLSLLQTGVGEAGEACHAPSLFQPHSQLLALGLPFAFSRADADEIEI